MFAYPGLGRIADVTMISAPRVVLPCTIVLALCCAANSVDAQSADSATSQTSRAENQVICAGGPTIEPDQQIAACTTVIEQGAGSPDNLAIAHNNRGNGLARKGEVAQALQDYARAVELRPDYLTAQIGRAHV